MDLIYYQDSVSLMHETKEATIAMQLINIILSYRNLLSNLAVTFMIGFHLIIGYKNPPHRYPDLFWVINNAVSCAFFIFLAGIAHLMFIKELQATDLVKDK